MSDSSIDTEYQKLYNLLVAQKWKKADEETTYLILKAVGKEKKGWMHIKDIQNLPLDHIDEIDHIWSTLTNKKFGLKVQKEKYSKLGGTAKFEYHSWSEFGRSVGWLYIWWRSPFQGSYQPQCRGNLPFHYLSKIKYESKRTFAQQLGLIGVWIVVIMLCLLVSPLFALVFQPIFYPVRLILFKQIWLPWYAFLERIR